MYNIQGFYKIKSIVNYSVHKEKIKAYLLSKSVKGTVILSPEGINGTISSSRKNLNLALSKVKKVFKFNNFDSQSLSKSKFQVFHRGKVKIKKEVVPMGIKISKRKFKNHVEPLKWNKLINDKNTFLIDARKPFEFKVGTFKNAKNPKINNFRDFPNYLQNLNKNKNIAMFCTGGIRCEKASTYLEKKGFKNVYQLKGGIINYLKKIKKSNSLWKGECYVFDNRVSLKHKLKQGSFSICSGCRTPISPIEKKSNMYEKGVSCPNCHEKLTESQKARFRMRQKQITLAKSKGTKHMFQKEYKI